MFPYDLITSIQIREFVGNYACGIIVKKFNPGYSKKGLNFYEEVVNMLIE